MKYSRKRNSLTFAINLKFIYKLKSFCVDILIRLFDIWKMAVTVPSRFACLKIEGDDYRPKPANPKPKAPAKTKPEPKVTQKPKKNVKPAKDVKTNGTVSKESITNGSSKPSSQKKKKENIDQWEKWKQKDTILVDGTFEEDLQNAILLSKLDYEEKKEMYQSKEEKPGTKKPKKKKTMSIEQFNNIGKTKVETTTTKDDKFFERIKSEAKEEVQRDKNRTKLVRELNAEAVTIAQYQVELENTRAENVSLHQELEKARADIINVKSRNKKLCSLLGQGEMRDKAEVLLEVERLTRVQEELTAEVTRLHELLEQERSKVGALTHEPKHKDKNKKRQNSESARTDSK